jgi:hypothetical protein
MDVTLLGMFNEVRELQPKNTPKPIDITLLGITTDARELQLLNA